MFWAVALFAVFVLAEAGPTPDVIVGGFPAAVTVGTGVAVAVDEGGPVDFDVVRGVRHCTRWGLASVS